MFSIAVPVATIPAAIAQTFTGNDTTNGPFSSGDQNFYDSSQLDASSAGAVTGGIQDFYNTSVLNASAGNAISGGRQNFYNSSVFNATAANAVTFGIVTFSDNSVLNVSASNAFIDSDLSFYDSSTFNASSADAVGDKIQFFYDTSTLNASAANAVSGGNLEFHNSSTLNASVANAVSGGDSVFDDSSIFNATASNAVSGGEHVFFSTSTFNASAADAVSNGRLNFYDSSMLNASVGNALSGGTQAFDDTSTLNASAANAVSGGIQGFAGDSTLNASAANAVSGGYQNFENGSMLNASAIGAIGGGIQEFYDASSLNASASDAVSAGSQSFYDVSALNASAANAVSGGTQNFYGLSRLEATVIDAISGGVQYFYDLSSLNAGTDDAVSAGSQFFYNFSALNASEADAVSGGSQFFYDSSTLEASASGAVSGGSQYFYGASTLEAVAADAVSGGEQEFYDTSAFNALAADAVSGGILDFYDSSALNASVSDAVSGGTQFFNNSSTLEASASGAVSGGTQYFYGSSTLEAVAADAVSGGEQEFYDTSAFNALAADAVSGGSLDFYDSSALNASASDAVSGGSHFFRDDSVLNASASNAVSGGGLDFYDRSALNASVAGALSGGEQYFNEANALNATAFAAVNGGNQYFFNTSVLNASAAGAVSSGFQDFYNTGALNASAVDAVNGGSQRFFETSTLNATAVGSVSGGRQLFFESSVLDVQTDNALTSGVDVQFSNDLGGVGGTLRLNGYSTVVGGISSTSNGSGVVTNGGADDSILTVDTSRLGDSVFSGVIEDGGQGALDLTKDGVGALTLNGVNTYTGPTTVSAGALIVGDSSADGANARIVSNVLVEDGATLGGVGVVGATTVEAGGTVSPGGGSSGIGTLHVDGTLVLEQYSYIAYEAGAPGVDFSVPGTADSIYVDGDLVLEGATLDVVDAGGFGPGLYRVFDYTGELTTVNGGLALGDQPSGSELSIQYLDAQKQINLVNTASYTLVFWNANGLADVTRLGGGDGVWSNTTPVWANADGSVTGPMSPQPGFAIFGGDAGTVTVDNGEGAVEATGMQFVVGGYTLTGDELTLVADASDPGPVEIRVGDGGAASSSYVATIENVIAGSDGLEKTGAGTLILSGANSYSGGTIISNGVLSVSSDGNLGDAGGALTFDGGALRLGSSFDLSGSRAVTLEAGGGVIDTNGFETFFSQNVTGEGSLTKTGAGALTLGGLNTYTGQTNIDAGVLALSGSGSIASSSGVVVDGTFDISAADGDSRIAALSGSGSVVLGDNDLDIANASGTFSGTIAGEGGVDVEGGVQVLTGANSFAGDLGVADGAEARIGDGGVSGSIVGDVVNEGSLVFDRSDALTYAGVISGDGVLTITGGGEVTLTGNNSFGGGTTIDNSTLAIGDGGTGGALGTGDTEMTGDATLIFNRSDVYAYAGAIAGTGDLVQEGGGVTELAGDLSSFVGQTTVSAGTLRMSTVVGGDLDIETGATADFALVDDAVFDETIAGDGMLVKSEDASLTLTADSSGFLGATHVDGGMLIVNGALGSEVEVASGATLGGTGPVGATTIASGGAHAPGNGIGAQTVNGDYINYGSLVIDGTPDAFDMVVVNGTVDISGGALELLLSPETADDWDIFNGPYTIIANDGADAVTGEFATVDGNLIFLDDHVDYSGGDGNDVTLELVRNDVDFASVAYTRNQRATARGISTLPDSNAVWRAIAVQPDAASARAAYDLLSGEIYASAKSALIEDSHFVRDAVYARMRSALSPDAASSVQVASYGKDGATQPATDDRFALWGQTFGSWGSIDSDGNAATIDTSSGGLFSGFDVGLGDNARLGVIAGYSYLGVDNSARASTAQGDNWYIGAYGGGQWGNLALRAGATYTWNAMDVQRNVTVSGVSGRYEADQDTGLFQVFGELGYDLQTGGPVSFEPFANLAYVNLQSGGFNETGGAAALGAAGGQSTQAVFTTLGLRASGDFTLGGVNAGIHGMVGWRHADGDLTPVSRQFFAGSDMFTVAGPPIARDAALVELGMDIEVTDNATFGINYLGQFGGGAVENGFNALFSIDF
ncbi:MAG: outer membrane autotransporter barrel domain-containing protein [Rhizobiaceae bacterium MnEN-MB40S]|nr:MAG: outer membrane autotransporter barrel domain-containing protein [Rhizobiaceae bacterium MnEN-MB40S]